MLCNVQRYLMCRQWPISVASPWARKQQEIGKEEKSLLNLTGLMLFPSEGSGLSSAKISKSKNGSNIPCCHISSPARVCNTSTSLYAYVCAPRVGVLGGSQHYSRSCRRSLNAACSFASKLPGIEATENTDWEHGQTSAPIGRLGLMQLVGWVSLLEFTDVAATLPQRAPTAQHLRVNVRPRGDWVGGHRRVAQISCDSTLDLNSQPFLGSTFVLFW